MYLTDVIDAGMTADGFYYLEFKVITQEDAGHYTVYAVNDEGSAEAETSLIVMCEYLHVARHTLPKPKLKMGMTLA